MGLLFLPQIAVSENLLDNFFFLDVNLLKRGLSVGKIYGQFIKRPNVGHYQDYIVFHFNNFGVPDRRATEKYG
jgi:hypothetical protein